MAKKGSAASRGTPAVVALEAAGIPHTLHPYASPAAAAEPTARHAYGLEAAEALGLEPARIFKTLIVRSSDGLGVAVVPVAGSLDPKAYASALGTKRATLADPAEAERVTGYVLGGISPLGQKRRLPTVVDSSARAYGSIFVSAGRRGLQVELAPDDLIALTDARVAAIAASATSATSA